LVFRPVDRSSGRREGLRAFEEAVSLSTLTADHFSKHLNTVFALHDGSKEWPFTLRSVSTIPGPSGKRQPFSLVFIGVPGVVFPQRMYPFDHAALGRLSIFIVPIGADAEGTQYEAIFS
jgi:hypothetical protein